MAGRITKQITAVINVLSKSLDTNTALASEKRNAFHCLISTILSHRTLDEKTEQAGKLLFARFFTPEKLACASVGEIRELIKPVGFYRVKAERIKLVAQILVQKYGSRVPNTLEELTSLPGVGIKTAACVMVYGFGLPAIPVDTHVHRISNRLGWVRTKTPRETQARLEKIVPRVKWISVNELFVRFGKTICRPINPHCSECPVNKHCEYCKQAWLKKKGRKK